MRRVIVPVLAAALALVPLACLVGKDPKLQEAFVENFDSGRLDPQVWRVTHEGYEVRDGSLFVEGAKNHPLWLRRRVPCDVRIDFVAWSESLEGDIKVELFGDGRSTADDEGAYTGTGYVIIFGGWRNTVNTIARKDEHAGRVSLEEDTKVEKGRRYRFSIRAKGNRLEWFLDGRLFLDYEDKDPICGPGNEHFGFSNWSTPVHFDDLSITPL